MIRMRVRELMPVLGLDPYGRLVIVFFAFVEWASVLLYAYCLRRFNKNELAKLLTAILALSTSAAATVVDREICRPVAFGRSFLNEFDIVVIVEKSVSLLILFYGLWKLRRSRSVRGHAQMS
jgi:hypothetical protein